MLVSGRVPPPPVRSHGGCRQEDEEYGLKRPIDRYRRRRWSAGVRIATYTVLLVTRRAVAGDLVRVCGCFIYNDMLMVAQMFHDGGSKNRLAIASDTTTTISIIITKNITHLSDTGIYSQVL